MIPQEVKEPQKMRLFNYTPTIEEEQLYLQVKTKVNEDIYLPKSYRKSKERRRIWNLHVATANTLKDGEVTMDIASKPIVQEP